MCAYSVTFDTSVEWAIRKNAIQNSLNHYFQQQKTVMIIILYSLVYFTFPLAG